MSVLVHAKSRGGQWVLYSNPSYSCILIGSRLWQLVRLISLKKKSTYPHSQNNWPAFEFCWKFWKKKAFSVVQFVSLFYKTNRFHVAVHLLSKKSQKTSKCGTFCSYHILTSSVYGLLTKCEVKMAGYWPSFFFFLLFYEPWRSRGPWLAKTRTKTISSHLDRAHLVNKGLIIWLSGKCSCGTRWVFPSR